MGKSLRKEARLEFRALLRAHHLVRIMGAQSASTYANQVIAFVIPWMVLSRTGSALNAGTVAFAMGVAAFMGTLLGGLVTDRIGGRKMSIIADALSFITTLFLALTLFLDMFALWIVIISQMLGVFFDGPGMVAKNTTIPAAAEKHKVPLVRAMGLQQTLQNLAMFIGPISAGVLIALLTESYTLILASALFAIAIYLVTRLPRRIMQHKHPIRVRQSYRDMKEAVMFIVKEPFLGPMQLFGPLYAFVLGPVSAIIFPAWFVFAGASSAQLGIFLGIQAIGGVLGGFIFAAFAPKVSQHTWLTVATAAYAFALFALHSLQPGSPLVLTVGFLAGLVFTGIMAIPYTAFYTRTPESLLGRVNSLGAASGALMIAFASLFFGSLVNATSPSAALLVCAAIMGLIAVGALVLPFMKHLDDKPAPDEETSMVTNI